MPATGLKIVGTGACLPWCSISSSFQNSLKKSGCNKVNDQEEGGGIRQTFLHFINKINKHKIKAAAPHGRLPHTKYKLKSRPGPLLSFTVVTLPFTLPKLLRGTRDRCVAQVSFIIIYSTGLALFPWLSAPPHSSHTPIDSRRPGV